MLAIVISAVAYLAIRMIVALSVYGAIRKAMSPEHLADPLEVQVARIFALVWGSAGAVYIAHQLCRRLIGEYPQRAVLAVYLSVLGWMCLSVWMDATLSDIGRAQLMFPAIAAMATAVIVHWSSLFLREREGDSRV